MPTPLRAMRIPEDVWRAAMKRAESEGTNVTATVVAALRLFVKPQRLRHELNATFAALEAGDVAVATFHLGEIERLVTTQSQTGRQTAGH